MKLSIGPSAPPQQAFLHYQFGQNKPCKTAMKTLSWARAAVRGLNRGINYCLSKPTSLEIPSPQSHALGSYPKVPSSALHLLYHWKNPAVPPALFSLSTKLLRLYGWENGTIMSEVSNKLLRTDTTNTKSAWVRTEQIHHSVLLIYEVLLRVSTGFSDTIPALMLCPPVQWHQPPKQHWTCMRFFSSLRCSRWLRQQSEGNYPARLLHHGMQEKRSNFSLRYYDEATRLNNWWKSSVSCFPLFPCRPSCICDFCILHKLENIRITFITSRGGNKLAAEYKLHQHDRSSLSYDTYGEGRKGVRKLLKIYCNSH